MPAPDPDFWRGRRVLITGHTGFKGAWLTIWLERLGANITGISLPPSTQPNLFTLTRLDSITSSHFCDIRNQTDLAKIMHGAQPEVVLHLAAQPLVRESYDQPVDTFSTNVMGTVHVLDALRGLDCAKVAVLITTDKVYRNQEWFWPYREEDPLGGHDPYSASKAASEIAIASYRDAFLRDQGTSVASARAGNVIGGGDWSDDRLIPDAIRAWQGNSVLEVRRPLAVRPWQHVLEPLAGYLGLAHALWTRPGLMGSYNFGPETGEVATVQEVVQMAQMAHGTGRVNFDTSAGGPHEAGKLALEIAKARETLGYQPRWDLPVAIERTISWYLAQQNGADARDLCCNEIAAYEAEP